MTENEGSGKVQMLDIFLDKLTSLWNSDFVEFISSNKNCSSY